MAAPSLFTPDGTVTVTAAALWIDEAWAEVGEVGPLTHHRPVPLPWWKSIRANPVVVGGLGGLALLVVGALVAAFLLRGGSSDPSAVAVPRTRPVVSVTTTTPRPTASAVAAPTVPATVATTTTVKKTPTPTKAPTPAPTPAPAPDPDPDPGPPPTDPPAPTTSTTTEPPTTSTTEPPVTTTVPSG